MNLRKLKGSWSGSVAVSDTFDVNNFALIDVDIDFRNVYAAHLEGIWIRLTNISGASVDKVTIKITSDIEGDIIVIPDTEATIARGLTTTNSGFAVYKVDLDYINGEKLYVFARVSSGGATLSKADLTYQREV